MTIFAQKHTIKITPLVHKLLKTLSAQTNKSMVCLADAILLEGLIENFEAIPELKHHISKP